MVGNLGGNSGSTESKSSLPLLKREALSPTFPAANEKKAGIAPKAEGEGEAAN